MAICRVERGFADDGRKDYEYYVDGSARWWRWKAPTSTITSNGFVSKEKLAEILGYKPSYSFRGIGPAKAGLKQISKDQFDAVLQAFRGERQPAPKRRATPRSGPFGSGGESDEHRNLKHYVAENAGRLFGSSDVASRKIELPFPSGDKADVVLDDQFGRAISIEIEVDVGSGDIVGPLQALKYRAMLELMDGSPPGEGRAALVAYTISPAIRHLCKAYNIECIAVARVRVKHWLKRQDGA